MAKKLKALVLLVLGIATLVFAKSDSRNSLESTGWPTATGVVVSSQMETRSEKNHSDKYYPDIEYEYEVDSTKYEGYQVSYSFSEDSDRSAVERIVGDYPAGKQVEVYYKPEDPGESVLRPGGVNRLPQTIVGWALVVVSVLLFFRNPRG